MHEVEREVSMLFGEGAKNVTITAKAGKEKRTSKQNAFYFKNVNEIAKFLEESGVCKRISVGDYIWNFPITKDEIHGINKKFLHVESTAKLSKKEFIEFMDKMVAYWQQKTNGFWQPFETAREHMKGLDEI